MTIKVTMPNGVQIEGDTREDLKEIFGFIESETEPKKRTVYLSDAQYKVYCCISDFPGSHSGQIATMLRSNKGTVSSVLNTLKEMGVIRRREDGHYGWLVCDDVEIATAVQNGA